MTDRPHHLYEDQHRRGGGASLDERDAMKERAEKAERENNYLRTELRRAVAELDRIRAERDAWSEEAGQRLMKAAVRSDVDVDTKLSPAEALDLVVEQGTVLRHEYKNLAVSELCRLRERLDTLETRIALKDGVERERDDLRAKVARQRRELRRLNRAVALLRGKVGARSAYAKTKTKPAEDRVVRVGDVWRSGECDLEPADDWDGEDEMLALA